MPFSVKYAALLLMLPSFSIAAQQPASQPAGAPQPTTMAANPVHPRRSIARPLRHRYGSKSSPPMPNRSAAMSHGVILVRRPRRATTIHPDQMQAAPRPQSAPRVYWADVGFAIVLLGLRCSVELSRPPKLLRPPDSWLLEIGWLGRPLTDKDGRVLARGTTTCLIFEH